jgi:hypothetical protein
MHFNDNKYRFQSRRNKHQHDRGDVALVNSIATLLKTDYSNLAAPSAGNQTGMVQNYYTEKRIPL